MNRAFDINVKVSRRDLVLRLLCRREIASRDAVEHRARAKKHSKDRLPDNFEFAMCLAKSYEAARIAVDLGLADWEWNQPDGWKKEAA